VVASYPLSSQAPTPVEVELGCDNIYERKPLRPSLNASLYGHMDSLEYNTVKRTKGFLSP
jgi:hypothetical protein